VRGQRTPRDAGHLDSGAPRAAAGRAPVPGSCGSRAT